jgi:hypothetical protein
MRKLTKFNDVCKGFVSYLDHSETYNSKAKIEYVICNRFAVAPNEQPMRYQLNLEGEVVAEFVVLNQCVVSEYDDKQDHYVYKYSGWTSHSDFQYRYEFAWAVSVKSMISAIKQTRFSVEEWVYNEYKERKGFFAPKFSVEEYEAKLFPAMKYSWEDENNGCWEGPGSDDLCNVPKEEYPDSLVRNLIHMYNMDYMK